MDNNNFIIEKSDYTHKINGNDTVFRMDLGKYSEIKYISHLNNNNSSSIKKLNKYEYIVVDTGEIKQYNLDKPTSKSDVNRKLKKYENLVLANFTGGASELFVTLNCENDITDIADIKQMYNNFLDNIKKDYKDLDYIALFQQNSNWCWHIHLFIKNNQHKRLYIEREKLIKYWGNKNVYVMPNINTFQTLGHSKDKRDDQLERYTYFPKGEKMYHKSKGIKIPKKVQMQFKDCPEFKSNDYSITSAETYMVRNEETDKIINAITTIMYRNNKSKTER